VPRRLKPAKQRALITPAAPESIGIRAIQPVTTAGSVDLGRDGGTTTELVESLTMTLPEFVKIQVMYSEFSFNVRSQAVTKMTKRLQTVLSWCQINPHSLLSLLTF